MNFIGSPIDIDFSFPFSDLNRPLRPSWNQTIEPNLPPLSLYLTRFATIPPLPLLSLRNTNNTRIVGKKRIEEFRSAQVAFLYVFFVKGK